MSPAFSYGRSRKAYRYYVSAPLQKGGTVHEDDTLRRVPGQAADDLVINAVSCLTRSPVTASDLGQHLRRVELHAESVHMVLTRPSAQDAPTYLAALERRLAPSERATLEGPDQTLVRVIMPVRLKVRGGRSWMALPDGRSPDAKARVDSTLVRGLSNAHGVLAEMGVRPDGRAIENHQARGAATAYRRLLANLAFLAPGIQSAIVAGRQPAGLKLEHLLRSDQPLAWADQKAKFGF